MTSRRLLKSTFAFVGGFSLIFVLMGIVLQTLLADLGPVVQRWLSIIAGVCIIGFGLVLLGLIPWRVKSSWKRQRKGYLSSFLLGATFAVGWVPCVGPVLGAVLSLAATSPGHATLLLCGYAAGMAFPFLLIAWSLERTKKHLLGWLPWVARLRWLLGLMMVLLGALILTQKVERLAVFAWSGILLKSAQLRLSIAFLAGILSVLSPCVLPLIPGFLANLAKD